jgi:uncharacterized protein (TIGR02118 family)
LIRTIALIKRLPQLDRDAFRTHYETVHAPLALPHLEGLERYLRNHVERELYGDVAFDVVSAFWYRNQAAIDRILTLLESEEGAAIRADELRFMDTKANRFFPVSERRLLPGDEGDRHLFVVVARPEAMSRFECSKTFVRDHWPRLRDALDAPGFALLRDAVPMAGSRPPCDLLLQVRAESFRGLEGWARSLEAEGYRVAAVETRCFETPLACCAARAGS